MTDTTNTCGEGAELKPCPFHHGGKSPVSVKRSGKFTFYVECYGGCRGPKESSESGAIREWNHRDRVVSPPQPATMPTREEVAMLVLVERHALIADIVLAGAAVQDRAVEAFTDKLLALFTPSAGVETMGGGVFCERCGSIRGVLTCRRCDHLEDRQAVVERVAALADTWSDASGPNVKLKVSSAKEIALDLRTILAALKPGEA